MIVGVKTLRYLKCSNYTLQILTVDLLILRIPEFVVMPVTKCSVLAYSVDALL